MDDIERLQKEIRWLQSDVKYWKDAYLKVKDENEKLSLDLGIKDSAQSPHLVIKKE